MAARKTRCFDGGGEGFAGQRGEALMWGWQDYMGVCDVRVQKEKKWVQS